MANIHELLKALLKPFDHAKDNRVSCKEGKSQWLLYVPYSVLRSLSNSSMFSIQHLTVFF